MSASGVLASPLAHEPRQWEVLPFLERPLGADARWSWACRLLAADGDYQTISANGEGPAPGDVAVVRVEKLGEHQRLTTRENRRLRLYAGDRIVAVFGNRYATDAFEAEVTGTESLSLLTGAGMVGTLRSRHRGARRPTALRFESYLIGPTGARINLRRQVAATSAPVSAIFPAPPVLAVVGTAMNSGKTTSSVKLLHSLGKRGIRACAAKLTGSVSNRDQDEMRSAASHPVVDFSDYGYPSTYLVEKPDLLDLFERMIADLSACRPALIVMEIADGILQRETRLLLEDDWFKSRLSGVLLSAESPLAALYAVSQLERWGHRVLAVTGAMSSSPLAIREFQSCSAIPVVRSTGNGQELGELVAGALELGA